MASVLGNKYALAGIAVATAVVGYCVYFDQKRRSAPNFRKKLAEKRKLEKEREKEALARKAQAQAHGGPSAEAMKDPRALKQFFVDTMAAGQEAMQQGDYDKAAPCFANALLVYQDPQAMLQVLQQTLPPDLFMRVVDELRQRRPPQ